VAWSTSITEPAGERSRSHGSSGVSGLGLGNGRVALGLAVLIVAGVAYLAMTRVDVQAAP
jgi:hypothetical protein